MTACCSNSGVNVQMHVQHRTDSQPLMPRDPIPSVGRFLFNKSLDMPDNLFDLSLDDLRDTSAALESQIASLTTTLNAMEPPELDESRLQYNMLTMRLSSLRKEIALLDTLTRVPEDENELLRVENLPVFANAVEAKYRLLMGRIDIQIENMEEA